MSKAFDNYNQIIDTTKEAESSQMFGKPCGKIKSKPFIAFHEDKIAFRVGRDNMDTYLQKYPGSHLLDPSGKGRPFKDWIHMPDKFSSEYGILTKQAIKFTLYNL